MTSRRPSFDGRRVSFRLSELIRSLLSYNAGPRWCRSLRGSRMANRRSKRIAWMTAFVILSGGAVLYAVSLLVALVGKAYRLMGPCLYYNFSNVPPRHRVLAPSKYWFSRPSQRLPLSRKILRRRPTFLALGCFVISRPTPRNPRSLRLSSLGAQGLKLRCAVHGRSRNRPENTSLMERNIQPVHPEWARNSTMLWRRLSGKTPR